MEPKRAPPWLTTVHGGGPGKRKPKGLLEHVQGGDSGTTRTAARYVANNTRLLTNEPVGTGVKIKEMAHVYLASGEATDMRYTQFLTLTNALINIHILYFKLLCRVHLMVSFSFIGFLSK